MPNLEIPVYTPQDKATLEPTKRPWWLMLVGFMVLFLLFYLGFWLGKGQQAPAVVPLPDPGEVLAARFAKAPQVPNQLTFIFFDDANKNGVFDSTETSFHNISVELRRRGQEFAFQTLPVDSSGRAVVSGLTPADYEVRYSYADYTGISYGDFNLHTWYQIILPTGEAKSIPTDWGSLGDTSEIKIGISQYVPDKLIVGQIPSKLYLIDPAFPDRSYGESTIFSDNSWYRFTLSGDKIYYLYNNELKFFDVKNRLTQMAIRPAYLTDQYNYRLSPDTRTLIYPDNGELSYITRDDWCGQGAVFDSDGYRILASNLRINFRDNQQLVAVAKTSVNENEKVYLIGCHDGRFEGFATDWAVDTVSPEPVPATWQEGSFKLDILLGSIDL